MRNSEVKLNWDDLAGPGDKKGVRGVHGTPTEQGASYWPCLNDENQKNDVSGACPLCFAFKRCEAL